MRSAATGGANANHPMAVIKYDDLETSDRYIAIPHKNDLDLGRNLALRLVEQQLPAYYGRVVGHFRRKGAYTRFKHCSCFSLRFRR